jgi:hypothetical protein
MSDLDTIWIKRLRDVAETLLADRGGLQGASESEKALTRRASVLIVECESIEAALADRANIDQNLRRGLRADYLKIADSLRRVLESMGLQRRARPVNGDGVIENDAYAIVKAATQRALDGDSTMLARLYPDAIEQATSSRPRAINVVPAPARKKAPQS